MSFKFKQFHVEDGRCAMKTGTDGVLLGAWTAVPCSGTVLDVGAGSGVISLMIAQRTPCDVKVEAVEVDAEACHDCAANFEASPWASRLKVTNADFLAIKNDADYSLIVSNPPFFNGQLKAPDASRAKARQGDSLNYISLIRRASQLLNASGKLAFISHYCDTGQIVFEAELCGLHVARRCDVISVQGKSPIRILWELHKQPAQEIRTQLVIRHEDGTYTSQYKQLTSDFYL